MFLMVSGTLALAAPRGDELYAAHCAACHGESGEGAKASDNSPTKKREKFNSGQIKTHFGKALVKILNEKYLNPNAQFAIAHPNDYDIKKTIGHLIPFLKKLEIDHFWVSTDKKVEKE